MLQGKIQVTSFDMGRLFAMIEQMRKQGFAEPANLDKLEEELARCDEVDPGDTADVTMNAFSEPGTDATALLFTGPWLRNPVELPGVFGTLGILTLPIGVAKTDADQQAVWRVHVPRHGAKGFALPIQGLAIHRAGNDTVRTLTNTATIRVSR